MVLEGSDTASDDLKFQTNILYVRTYFEFTFSGLFKSFLNFFFSVLRPFQDYFSSYETDQTVGGQKWENPKKNHLAHPGPASRTWLVSHVASAGLEPTPDTAVR